jgi:hypothetical protein
MGENPHWVFPSCDFSINGGNIMFGNTFVSLSGFGHLCDIGYDKDSEMYITLHLINESNDSRSDELWVKCRVNLFDFPEMARFKDYLAMERSVIVKFDAQYLGFQQCYSGMSENDPLSIVHLLGKLLNIHEYYIEEENISSLYNHSIETHIVSHRLRA